MEQYSNLLDAHERRTTKGSARVLTHTHDAKRNDERLKKKFGHQPDSQPKDPGGVTDDEA
jgi:hypothetical protein